VSWSIAPHAATSTAMFLIRAYVMAHDG